MYRSVKKGTAEAEGKGLYPLKKPKRDQSEGEKCQGLSVVSRKYDNPFPLFRKPEEIGSFSQDHARKFHNDRRQLRYYIKPSKLYLNLSQGYKSFIRKDDSTNEYLNDLLKWIMCSQDRFAVAKSTATSSASSTTTDHCEADTHVKQRPLELESLHTDFICWRGLLTKLLCTPYENRDDWMIAVTKFRGTYFLCEFKTEKKKKEEAQMSRQQDEMAYWGWKFEQYVTAGTIDGKPDTDQPVNNNEGFCSVIRTRLDSHSLVFGGEVDAWEPSIQHENKYVEFKTSRIMQPHSRQEQNFIRFKLIKWWAQSFLLGITKVVSGFRDDNGVVLQLQEYEMQKIPHLAKGLQNPWQPNVCFNFLDSVLRFIKQSVTVDDSSMVHLLSWSPGEEVQCRCVGRDSEYSFLPPWFVNWQAWSPTWAEQT